MKNIAIHVYREWVLDRTVRLGAGIAYYMIVALIPLVTLAIGVSGLLFTSEQVSTYITEIITGTYGGSLEAVDTAFNSLFTVQEFNSGFRSLGLIGAFGLIISVGFLVVALQDAINAIWQRPVVKGIKHSIKRYLGAYGVVVLVGTMILVCLLLYSLSSYVVDLLPVEYAVGAYVAEALGVVVTTIVLVGFLALLFKVLIGERVDNRQLIIGAATTTVLLQIGTALLGWYFSTTGAGTAAGAFGSVMLLLGWMYYISQILLIGIQTTKVLSYRTGNKELQTILQRSDPSYNKKKKKS